MLNDRPVTRFDPPIRQEVYPDRNRVAAWLSVAALWIIVFLLLVIVGMVAVKRDWVDQLRDAAHERPAHRFNAIVGN